MKMFAYIFLPTSKKYLSVKSTTIEDFWYETPGRQSKEFASKTFKFIGINEKTEVCQILIVAATITELNKLIAKKRITVPKLNNSDLRLAEETSETDKEKTKVKKTRSNLKKDIVESLSRTNSNIIQAHLANTASKTCAQKKAHDANEKVQTDEVEVSNASQSTKSDDEERDNLLQQNVHNEKYNSRTFEDNNDESQKQLNDMQNTREIMPAQSLINDEGFSNADDASQVDRINKQQNNVNEPAFHANNMNARLLEENNRLKKEISKLRRDKVTGDRVNRMLQERFQNYKEKMNKKSQDKVDFKLKPKGLPTPICCNSGVFVRADAREDTYAKVKPSMFYERMCYLTWGRRILAQRCIKKRKNTPSSCKVLTPSKRRAVRKHFVHYLKYYKYHSVFFNNEMNKINDYAHRAIICSKRYAKLVEDYPDLATDEELEDVEMCEL